MQQVLKASLLAAAFFGFANTAFAQVEDLPEFHDEHTTENLHPPLPAPKQKGAIEQYQQGRFFGFRLDDSVLVEAKFDRLEQSYSDFMVARIGKKQGVVNGKGETVLPFEYDNIEKFEFEKLRNGRPWHTGFRWLKVSRDYKFGLLDPTGKSVLPIEWDRMSYTQGDTLMFVSKPGLQRLIGPSGQTLLETNYDGFDEQTLVFADLERGFFCAIKDGKTGLFDRRNQVILPFEFHRIVWVKGNFACVEKEAKRRGMVNLQGRQVLPPDFSEIKEMDENGLFQVKDFGTGLFGLADSSGHFRLSAGYASVRVISNSHFIQAKKTDALMAAFELGGKQLTDFVYDEFAWNAASPSLLLARTPDQNWQFLDATGKPLNSEIFKEMSYTQTAFTGKKNGKTAFFSLEGQRLTEYKFAAGAGIGKNEQQLYAAQTSLPEGRVLIGRAWDEEGRTIYIDDLGGEHLSQK